MALQILVRPVVAAVSAALGRPLTGDQVASITSLAAAYLRGRQPGAFAVAWFGWVAAWDSAGRRFAVPQSHWDDELIVHLLESIQHSGVAPIDFHDEGEWWEWRAPAIGLVARTSREGNVGWIGPTGRS